MRTSENILTESIVKQINNELELGFIISILDVSEDLLVVKVFQKEIKNGMMLTQKQLVAKGKEIFKNITGTIRIRPLTFTLDIREITPDWIKNRMKNLGIKRNDVISHLHIDKSTLSLYLNGSRNISRMGRSAFFWYFLNFEVNKELQ